MQKSRTIQSALGSRAFTPIPRVQVQFQRRNIQDVAISRTGRPILKVQGGRYLTLALRSYLSSTMLIQFQVTLRLSSVPLACSVATSSTALGCNVVIPYREEMAKRHLKVTGDLGRVTFLRIAEAVAKYDVDRFIHVSSYNASRDSPSEYWASKVG
ncbi:NADH-ubiquinone oxidoreductase 40 kDa subunit [Penicillium waksmanii]|uniref:NADH-ubiquinone oxidoreductase 40 kDa subunit n=1 Tax=Penicillium waksmanii TaxID=69791 RepID=UPI00254974C3|nr:NADH-ubiquinone oxidoreductase 40 kDa subunit [Penicillium waksmanii]KAJ5976236.1 NADH-ubiquinone oxidoreductase 40 kDa subunit [Penicillium waksmanii]